MANISFVISSSLITEIGGGIVMGSPMETPIPPRVVEARDFVEFETLLSQAKDDLEEICKTYGVSAQLHFWKSRHCKARKWKNFDTILQTLSHQIGVTNPGPACERYKLKNGVKP